MKVYKNEQIKTGGETFMKTLILIAQVKITSIITIQIIEKSMFFYSALSPKI